MSTKIYFGYRVKASDPFAALHELIPAVQPVYQRLYHERLAMLAHAFQQGEAPGLGFEDPSGGVPILKAWRLLDEGHTKIRASGHRNPILDLELDACFLRDGDQLYAMLYTEQDAYRAAYPALFEHWPYWNNTDRPDDVTEDEWDERRDTWDRVVGWDPPARRGLGWELIGLGHAFTPPKQSDAADVLGPYLPDGFNVDLLYTQTSA